MRKKLLTNGNVFKRTDNRWCGVVWYMDEQGNRKRKSFSGTTKQEPKLQAEEHLRLEKQKRRPVNEQYHLTIPP